MAIVPGVLEAYFFQDSDCKKGSNNQITVLVRILELVKQVLYKKGIDMPEHLLLRAPIG